MNSILTRRVAGKMRRKRPRKVRRRMKLRVEKRMRKKEVTAMMMTKMPVVTAKTQTCSNKRMANSNF